MSRKSKQQEPQVVCRIEELRAKKKLSRQELADLVGVHYQTIGYLERGEYSPSLVLALQIAQALNTTVEKIFSLEGQNNG